MATTRSPITIPKNTWTDLYAATGIAVGTAVDIWNLSSDGGQVAASSSTPSTNTIGIPLYTGRNGYLRVTSGEAGLWCFSQNAAISIIVQD